MPKTMFGALFAIFFIPVFIASLFIGERKEGEGELWYFIKKFVLSAVIAIVGVAGASWYMLANGI